MNNQVIIRLSDLEPLVENGRFVCMFTGHYLNRAYLIGGKYGSFYDPIIAGTYIQAQLGKTIDKDNFSKYRDLIVKDTSNNSAPFFNEIISGDFSDFCAQGQFCDLLDRHLEHWGKTFEGNLTDAEDYVKKLKEKKKPRKKISEQKNEMYMYVLSGDELSSEKKIQTNEMVDLSVLFPGLKMTVINVRPGNTQIYLSNGDPPEMNPQANALIGKYSVSDSHKGTVVLISKSAIS